MHAKVVRELTDQLRSNRNEMLRHRWAAFEAGGGNWRRLHLKNERSYEVRMDQTQLIARNLGLAIEVDEEDRRLGRVPFQSYEDYLAIKQELGA